MGVENTSVTKGAGFETLLHQVIILTIGKSLDLQFLTSLKCKMSKRQQTIVQLTVSSVLKWVLKKGTLVDRLEHLFSVKVELRGKALSEKTAQLFLNGSIM